MEARTVDARGCPCPRPLILTRKAFAELGVGEGLNVLLDSEIARDNVLRFLEDQGAVVTATEADGAYTLRARKGGSRPVAREVEPRARAASFGAAHVVVIRSDRMGTGSDELGEILLRAFLETLPEVTPRPGAVVFYNRGVHLALAGSPVIGALGELEGRGIRLLVCGTCLDYYGVKDRLRAGTVSNMYDIIEAMSRAGHVIVP